jgi:nicotinamide mononucleotide transporter
VTLAIADMVRAVLTIESLAMVLALAYLLLAARESMWCWWCALASSLLYVSVFLKANLYTETALNVFYAVMAVVGWWQWRQGTGHKSVNNDTSDNSIRAIISFGPRHHAACLALTLVLALANGYVMQRYTTAAWPFVDAFISWGSVITTFLVVRKVLENWMYWIVLDGIAIVVYLDRGLYLTALLFAAYVVIAVFGYLRWLREYRAQPRLS